MLTIVMISDDYCSLRLLLTVKIGRYRSKKISRLISKTSPFLAYTHAKKYLYQSYSETKGTLGRPSLYRLSRKDS